MTRAYDPTDHNVNAAIHHELAARFHREASRHYQVGKDFAQAAHQALTAHGHALRALEHGQAANSSYTEYENIRLPSYLTRSTHTSDSTAVASPLSLNATAHHAVAAKHHKATERHHTWAGLHCSAEHYVRANHETKHALAHAKHALFHGDQAAMHHMEHYGSHPTAELT